jgi:hypothetical protein
MVVGYDYPQLQWQTEEEPDPKTFNYTVSIAAGIDKNLFDDPLPANILQGDAWLSTNEGIVIVFEGIITGIAEGVATVIYTEPETGNMHVFAVTITPAVIGPIPITEEPIMLKLRESKDMDEFGKAGSNPDNWSVVDENIVAIKDGRITGKAVGETFVYFTEADGTRHEFKVTVIYAPLEKSGWFYHTSADGKDATNQFEFKTPYFDQYNYSDKFFFAPATQYQQDLATMSMDLAFAAFGTSKTSNNNAALSKFLDAYAALAKWGQKLDVSEPPWYMYQSDHAWTLLNELEFTDIEPNADFMSKPGSNSIGVIIGNKQLILEDNSSCTLLAVAIRGGGYEDEWVGNFTVGNADFHQGFLTARDKTLAYLNEYLSRHQDAIGGRIKIWITGYSRAAATANLVAGKLDDGQAVTAPGVTLSNDDVYAYGFETPAGAPIGVCSTDEGYSGRYDNIFSLVNPNDAVPKVAPAGWGYRRYGITKYLPTKETSYGYNAYQSQMLNQYGQINRFYWNEYKIESEIKSGIERDKYVIDNFQTYVDKLSAEDLFDAINPMDDLFSASSMISSLRGFVLDALPAVWDHTGQTAYLDELMEVISGEVLISPYYYSVNYQETFQDIGRIIGGFEWDALAAVLAQDQYEYLFSGNSLSRILKDIAVLHPHIATTLFHNISSIGQAHYPEISLAWMNMLSSRSDGAGAILTDGKYRILTVNCPVDISVYDSSDKLVAQIADETIKDIENSSIIGTIDADAQKVLYLPADEEFTVKITATDQGHMTYSVDEFDLNRGQVARLVNYYGIPISTGDKFTGIVENLTSVEMAAYPLAGDAGQVVPDPDILEGNDIVKYAVNTSVEGQGKILGGGKFYKGEFALLMALPDDNNHFVGWYIDGLLVSSDDEYRMMITDEVAVAAKFAANTPGVSPTPTAAPSTSPTPTGSPSMPLPSYPIGGGSSSSPAPQTIVTQDISAAIINEALTAGSTPLINLSGSLNEVYFSGKELNASQAANKAVDVKKNRFTLSLLPPLINEWQLKDNSGVSVVLKPNAMAIDPTLQTKLKNIDAFNEQLLKEIYFTKIRFNSTDVTATISPIKVAVNLADWTNLTAEQKSMLTGVRYENELRAYKQLGGELSTDGQTFVFYTNQTGNLGLIITDNLIKLSFSIDSLNYRKSGIEYTNDAAPYLSGENRAMLPLRAIAEGLGAQVAWDEASRTVAITKAAQTIALIVDQPLPDGLGTPVILNSRTMVPIRYIAETLGANVIWDQASKTVNIYQ